jgi:protein-tyrosine phosphatase
MRIAFVCMGNICRSPMAEAVTRQLLVQAGLGAKVQVSSFGTTGYHAGDGADPLTVRALIERGWEPGEHVARHLRPSDLPPLDLVLCSDDSVMEAVLRLSPPDPTRVRLMRSFDPVAPPGAQVPDPYGRSLAAFSATLETIEPACRDLVDSLVSA